MNEHIRTAVIQIEELNENPVTFIERSRVKDEIGDFLGYARCQCGKSYWYADTNNPGIYLGGGKGKSICNECYLNNKEKINRDNEERFGKEIWVYDTSNS